MSEMGGLLDALSSLVLRIWPRERSRVSVSLGDLTVKLTSDSTELDRLGMRVGSVYHPLKGEMTLAWALLALALLTLLD